MGILWQSLLKEYSSKREKSVNKNDETTDSVILNIYFLVELMIISLYLICLWLKTWHQIIEKLPAYFSLPTNINWYI